MEGASVAGASWENVIYCDPPTRLDKGTLTTRYGERGEEATTGWEGGYLRAWKLGKRGALLEVRFQDRRYWAAYRNGKRVGPEFMERATAMRSLHQGCYRTNHRKLDALSPAQVERCAAAVERRQPLGPLAREFKISVRQVKRVASIVGAHPLQLCANPNCRRPIAMPDRRGGRRAVCSDRCGWEYNPNQQRMFERRSKTWAGRRGEEQP